MGFGEAVIVDGLRSLELGRSRSPVYDQEIGLQLLHEDLQSGEEHYLVRYPAGLMGRVHRHTAAHTIVVLDGRLQANDQVIGPGAYAHFPAGQLMRHAAAQGSSCLFVILFHGPFDVQVVDD